MRKEHTLRSLTLKAHWDGEDRASIDAPVDPFFCDAFGTPSEEKPVPLSEDMNANIPDEQERESYTFGLPLEYKNFLLGYTRARGYYACFPMPFFSGAKIVLAKITGYTIESIRYEVEYDTQNKSEPGLGRFHALYRREDPTLGIEAPEALIGRLPPYAPQSIQKNAVMAASSGIDAMGREKDPGYSRADG